MSNTVELLETIGSDASLRHASAPDLARTLAGMQATRGLRQAVASGDITPLEEELGDRGMQTLDSPVQSGFEEGNEDDKDFDDAAPPKPAK